MNIQSVLLDVLRFKKKGEFNMKIKVNGADRHNKYMTRIIDVTHADEKEICEKAFRIGFYYVRSYRSKGITVKII